MSSMSFLWMCLSLLYAASFLKSTASSGQVASLRCNQTVDVALGETAVLNCSIIHTERENCMGEKYYWNNTNGSIACNSSSKKYKCEWDNQTYVSLTISNVMKEENYTIKIVMDCDMDKSYIKVQIKRLYKHVHGTPRPEQDPESTSPHVTPAVLSVFAGLLVSGILYFLFGNGRGRKMIECIKKGKTHGHSRCTDTAGEKKTDCLTNTENSV